MIHVGSSVEGGGATGLDLPLRSSVFRCPAAEGRVIGPPKVAGKPQKSCKFVEERSSHTRGDEIIILIIIFIKRDYIYLLLWGLPQELP